MGQLTSVFMLWDLIMKAALRESLVPQWGCGRDNANEAAIGWPGVRSSAT